MVSLALALALTLAPGLDDDEAGAGTEQPRWQLAAGAGVLLDLVDGRGAAFGGAEVSRDVGFAQLGLLAQAYRLGVEGGPEWSPVLLLRIEQRFETHRGLEGALAFGLGAARLRTWEGWFQLALAARLVEGPLVLSGEVGFEPYRLLRLGLALGLRF